MPYRLATDLQCSARRSSLLSIMVRKKRLELLRLAAPEPKSGASTNFATSANFVDNLITHVIEIMAGLPGFEPGYDGIKTRCLTAWRQTYRIRYIWCGRRDLNPHVLRTLTPEASASTNSATTALNASNCNWWLRRDSNL